MHARSLLAPVAMNQQQQQQLDSAEQAKAMFSATSAKREKKHAEDKNELFERMLHDVGGFGRFQILLLVSSLFASFVAAFNHLGPIYLAFSPEYECVENG